LFNLARVTSNSKENRIARNVTRPDLEYFVSVSDVVVINVDV